MKDKEGGWRRWFRTFRWKNPKKTTGLLLMISTTYSSGSTIPWALGDRPLPPQWHTTYYNRQYVVVTTTI